MEAMLALDPTARLTLQGVTEHPWYLGETATLEEVQTFMQEIEGENDQAEEEEDDDQPDAPHLALETVQHQDDTPHIMTRNYMPQGLNFLDISINVPANKAIELLKEFLDEYDIATDEPIKGQAQSEIYFNLKG